MRTTIRGTGLSARLTVAGCAALAILASASVSACSGSSPSATPATFSPGGTGSATPTPDRTATRRHATDLERQRTPSRSTHTATPQPAITPPRRTAASRRHAAPRITSATPSRSASPVPTAAPATGGGGTAGFQDALLFGLGAAAILAGAGSIAYRRRITRNR